MKKKEQVKLVHDIKLVARRKNGTLIKKMYLKNTDVAIGRQNTARLLAGLPSGGGGGASGQALKYIAVTEHPGAITDASEGLGNLDPVFSGLVTPSIITTTTTDDTARFQAVISLTAAMSITKVGLFYHDEDFKIDGMAFAADVVPDLVMPDESALTVTWTVQVT